MSKYIIKAEISPGGGYNEEEYSISGELATGLEADGFLLITFRGGRRNCVAINGITTMEIAQYIAGDESEAGSTIRQAIAIADGLRKAVDIAKEERKHKMARDLADILSAKD